MFGKLWFVYGKTHRKTHFSQESLKIKGNRAILINVTIRREMGRDIDGACGQLRRSYMQEE